MGNEIGELIMEVSKKRFDEAGGVLYTFSLKRGF